MTWRGQQRRHGYTPPPIDSSKARAQATLFLTGARSLAGIDAAYLARTYRLSAKTAEYMLTMARQRRGDG